MNIDHKLLTFFKKYKKQLSVKELIKMLELKKDEIDFLLNRLYELEKEGKIIYDIENEKFMTVPEDFIYSIGTVTKGNSNNYYIKQPDSSIIVFKKNKFLKPGDTIYYIKEKTNHPKRYTGIVKRIITRVNNKTNNNYITKGILQNDGNHFYIKQNDKYIYIDKNSLKGAFSGDLVSISVKNNIGNVLEIIKKHHDQHVFKAVNSDGELYWTPIGGSFGKFYLKNTKFQDGDLILATTNNYQLTLIKKLDNANNLKSNVAALIKEHGFYDEFSKDTLNQIKKIKQIDQKDLKNRVDLRELKTITIDPINAKDLDDAISLEYDEDKYILYVHLANPANYIKINSPLFNKALKRGFSVYPNDSVIPMLPPELSSKVCSLNENGDKLAITFKVEIDKEGNIGLPEIFKSIIKNDKQMNYDEVNKFLIDKKNEEYQPFSEMLLKMQELSNILEQKKKDRGAITFNIKENSFILDKQGNPIKIEEIKHGTAQDIIENFMLLANENIALYAKNLGLPYYYRNHEKPTIQKKINLKNDLCSKGYLYDKLRNIDSPMIFQQFVNQILNGKSEEEKEIIYNIILKTMSRAYYSSENIGHYGLALDCYGTFTSPARKFTDLVNQMIISDFIENGYTEKQELYRHLVESTSEYISDKQKEADILEKDVNDLMLNYYATKYIDVEVNAKIICINQNKIYIKDENNLTGIIPINKNILQTKDGIIYKGKEYKRNSIIKVKLIKNNNEELIYNISEEKNKVLIKQRKD